VLEESFNLILQLSSEVKKIEEELSANIPEIEVFSIRVTKEMGSTKFSNLERRHL